jgi:hypothetical protein
VTPDPSKSTSREVQVPDSVSLVSSAIRTGPPPRCPRSTARRRRRRR